MGSDEQGGLRQAEQRFRLAFETAPIGMALAGPDGRLLRVNDSLCEIVGYPADVLLTKTFQDITHPDDLDVDLQQVRRLLADDIRTYATEKRYVHAGGHDVWVKLTVSLVRDDEGRPLYFITHVEDISVRRRIEKELWELALVDDLTGLHNRRSFMLLAEQAVKAATRAQRPVIALFVDVDHLKAINDNHGHAEGDRALRLVAGALRTACRASDIIGRLSGDEFAILLAEAEQMDGVAGRLRCRVADAARTTNYPLSVSIGVAMCEAGGPCDLTELFARADRAMYEEKVAKR